MDGGGKPKATKLIVYHMCQKSPLTGSRCQPVSNMRIVKDNHANMNIALFPPALRPSMEQHLSGDGMRLLKVSLHAEGDDERFSLAMTANTGDGDSIASAILRMPSQVSVDIGSIVDIGATGRYAAASSDDNFFLAIDDGMIIGVLRTEKSEEWPSIQAVDWRTTVVLAAEQGLAFQGSLWLLADVNSEYSDLPALLVTSYSKFDEPLLLPPLPYGDSRDLQVLSLKMEGFAASDLAGLGDWVGNSGSSGTHPMPHSGVSQTQMNTYVKLPLHTVASYEALYALFPGKDSASYKEFPHKSIERPMLAKVDGKPVA